MWNWDYNLYLGDNSEQDHIGFVTDTNFFIIAEGQDLDEDTFHGALEEVKQQLISEAPSSLEAFSALLQSGFDRLGEHLVSFAAALVVDDVIYFESRGNGEIYISRGGQTARLIHGDQTSSGEVHQADTFLLTNRAFAEQVTEERLRKLMFNTSPQEIVEVLTPDLKSNNDTGMFGLFLQAKRIADEGISQTEEVVEEDEIVEAEPAQPEVVMPVATPPAPRQFAMPNIVERLKSGSPMSKKITLVVVLVLVLVLGWSVMSGNARREKAKFEEFVAAQKTEVEGKLSEAEELAGINTQKSLSLIDESRSLVRDLEIEGEKKKMDLASVKELAAAVDETEQKIKKKEDGQASEFYDLELIDKAAEAETMYLDDGILALLDNTNKKVYMLDVAEKSVDSYTGKSAERVSIHQGVPYLFGKNLGILKLAEKNKQEEIVAKDGDWGDIADFWMYSGNIYLLDSSTPQIDKYLVAEGGAYSEKKPYLSEGQAGEIDGAAAMAIDSAIYVAVDGNVIKYASGAKVAFSVEIPDESDITFEDIYTARELEEVYLLDKDSQRIFVTDKDGGFKKQISAGVLKSVDDFVVDPEKGIFVLSGNVLYAIKD